MPSAIPLRPRRRVGRSTSVAGAIAALAVIGGCSLVESTTPPVDTAPVVIDTVGGVGVLPAFVAAEAVPATPTPATGVQLDPAGEPGLGRTPLGNRVLLIGDSIFAATATRLGGEMCTALEPLGWQVAVEAEVSRQVGFGVDVLRARADERWDVGVIFLGTNYNGDEDDYLKQLNRVITGFGTVPVVLVTASRHSEAMDEVNGVIRGLDDLYRHVTLIDWERVTRDDPGLLVSDGVHPSTAGRSMLTALIANHLGRAPAGAAGEQATGDCLDSVFVDDTLGEMPDLDAPAATGAATPTTSADDATMSTTDGTDTADTGDGATDQTTGDDGSGGGGAGPVAPDEDPEQEPPADG